MLRMKILVIPDAHAKPGVSNRRFEMAGRYIADTKPDVVVSIGDHYDMESLSSYDEGKACFEGRRLTADIQVGLDAFERLEHCSKGHKARKVFCLGNHEARLSRMMDSDSKLDGLFKLSDLQFKGWEMHDFLQVVNIAGVNFSHYFCTGTMGRPQGGEYPAANLIKKQFVSCVQGHSHVLDFATRTTAKGTKLMGVVVGCFLDSKQSEAYANPQGNNLWHKGLVTLKNVEAGSFDIETISIKALGRSYGR